VRDRLPLLGDLAPLQGRSVLVRVDFNVPMSEGAAGDTQIVDDFRIRAALPTLRYLVDAGATVTACSHLGRPDGPDPHLSLKPVAERLSSLLPEVKVLENLRFDPREKQGSLEFARELALGQDCFVNDAFGVCHREDASVVGLPRLLPSAAGLLVEQEVIHLERVRTDPVRPATAVLGGAKVSEKLALLMSLLERVDIVLVGGGMCFTFLAASGLDVGSSLCEPEVIDECVKMLATGKVVVPIDICGLAQGQPFGPRGGAEDPLEFDGTPGAGYVGLDIGAKTAKKFSELIAGSKTVFWNGPMGVFEDPRFRAGTEAVAEAVAASREYTVVGGGDSVAALNSLGLADKVSYVSTGGGASLAYLEEGDLVGLRALRESSC